MQFSEQWLRTLVDPALNSEELAHLLTMAGLEVEENEPAAAVFNQVFVAEVLSVQKHENADRLNVCQVNVGAAEPLQIVCGAANVAAGIKVPCARIGAVLPGDFKIKQAKVRGVESFGMLCSAKELGLAEEANGLLLLPADAPVGSDIRDYLQLDDRLLTLKLTPNRTDCLSLQGIAREVSALTATPWTPTACPHQTPLHDERRGIVLQNDACPRYTGRILRNVNAQAVTPDWMRRRLERSGLRSISALVDVTNYVLLELGQPMHAFDNDKLQGDIRVRFAAAGEQIVLLNEKTVTLDDSMLVIADDSGPVALAGIMGGAATAVGDDTRHVFLESAFFAPAAITGRARRLGFGSDSSYRFERGVDFAQCRAALERATQLMIEICGGEAGPVQEASREAALPARPPVSLRVSRVAKVLGVALDATAIAGLLTRLGLPCALAGDVITVTPPSFRFDLVLEEDLIEEVARLFGYDNIPLAPARASLAMLPNRGDLRPVAAVKDLLVARDYQEAINYAFVDARWEQDLAGNADPIKLQNPIASQMSVMRSTLWGGLLANLQHNLNRKQSRVRLFELARVFSKQGGAFAQPEKLAGLAFGSRLPEQWAAAETPVDFFDVKADVEALFAPSLSATDRLQWRAVQHPALHPGRAAELLLAGKVAGVVGELHPKWVQQYGLSAAPLLFELDVDALRLGRLPQAGVLSRFQSVRRDLAVVVDDGVPLAALLAALDAAKTEVVTAIELFDLYRGKGVEAGKKSLAFKVILQDTRKTLTDEEVESVVTGLLAALQNTFDAKLRT